MGQIQDKLKNNMLTAVLSIVVLTGASLTAAERTFGFIDKSVVSESEMHEWAAEHVLEAHPAALEAIAATEVKSECRWLRSEIRTLRDRIRELQRTGADPDWIDEKEVELSEMVNKWNERNCEGIQYI